MNENDPEKPVINFLPDITTWDMSLYVGKLKVEEIESDKTADELLQQPGLVSNNFTMIVRLPDNEDEENANE